jgi:hypothetical protein
VNFAEALQVGALAMLAIAALWAMATTRLGRRLRRRLRDHSASPPFGRWLARGRGGQPAVSRERLCARAMELSTAWDELKAKPLDLRIVFSDEAAAIAEALVPPTNDDEEHAVSRLTDAFPYAALAAAERALVDDRALARRLIAPHAHAPLGAIRRRVRQIERLLGSSEVETVGVA